MNPLVVTLAALVLLALVAGYLVHGLPRLPPVTALGVTALAAVSMLALAAMPGLVGVVAPMMGVTALLAGHAGWSLGRNQRRQATREAKEKARQRQHKLRTARISDALAASPVLASAPAPAPPSTPTPTTAPRPPRSPATHPTPVSATATHPGVKPEGAGEDAPRPGAVKFPPNDPAMPSHGGLPMADLQRTALGRYRIERALGRGSMGAVFLGTDSLLGRQVAIKTMALGQEFQGAELEEAKRRFFREAETAGRLQHRDIVTIFDVGEEDELAYIAMEFLKGHDLQRHTHPSSLLPVPVVLRIGARVADALAYAHGQGVVHRDVKPANVMLHLPSGAVKVTDFGIARITDASRTRTGMVLGTPSFMAPEHLAGQRVDGRADIYSLGVMLFQLLCGQLPFQADSMAKLMYQIANGVAPDIRTVRAELPESVARALAWALSKSVADRPHDGAALADELRKIDSAGTGPLWGSAMLPMSASATATDPPGTSAYDATVRVVPGESGHNSSS